MSSKSDHFWLKYGDAPIFKMAAVCHLGFCLICRYSGSILRLRTISRKLNNPLMYYGKNNISQYGVRSAS